MDIQYAEWLNLIFRWVHLITGIAWIGSSFYFVWLDLSLRNRGGLPKGAHGEAWMVHGGGFYNVQKYLVAPEKMPEDLHWFKYEAYFTWITGFFLMAIIYYWGADTFLIDKAKMNLGQWEAIGISLGLLAGGYIIYDLLCRSPIGKNTGILFFLVFLLAVGAAWLFAQVFSDRAAFLHVGAFIGSIMVGNVFFIIIPNQKKVVASLMANETPDPALGAQAKQRSLHNNYFTLPVLLMMISNHYPMTFGHKYSWAIVAGILVVGGLVRHHYNRKNSGDEDKYQALYLPLAAVAMVGVVLFATWRPDSIEITDRKVTTAEVVTIIEQRCMSCHSESPTDSEYVEAPGGIEFYADPDVAEALYDMINAQAGLTKAMPQGNRTGMTELERAMIRAWAKDLKAVEDADE